MTHPASTDAVVAAVLVLMGNTVSAILIHPTARAANAVACALSAAVLIATQTQTYHRHRNVMAVMYRLVREGVGEGGTEVGGGGAPRLPQTTHSFAPPPCPPTGHPRPVPDFRFRFNALPELAAHAPHRQGVDR
jgi:hypothetical protein